MTATEILTRVRAANPGVRYAEAKGTAVGEFVPGKNRFVAIFLASRSPDGSGALKWTNMIQGGFIKEVLADGKPMYGDADWVE